MSFILDALKKSEADRQLGEVPSLQAAGDYPQNQGSKRTLRLPVLILLIVLVLVTVGWLWKNYMGRESGRISIASLTDTPAQQAIPSKLEYRSSDNLPHIERKQTPIAVYTPPADVKAFSGGMDMPDTGKIISISQNTTEAAAKNIKSTGKTSESKPSGLPDGASRQQRIERMQKQRAAERADDEALVATVEQRLANEAAAKQKKKKTAAKRSEASTVRLNELPSSVRSALPDLSISMQVYSSQAESRFAIINGKRYVESDQLADSVILDEILRQGIVLKYRKYRILIK